MKTFLTIIKYDYLQRTRSYAFLITLCASLAIAYTFVPEPNANYSTLRISDYVGFYNSAWFGYVTAIMTSVFLSLIGYYLINSGIKNDSATKIGQIIATTSVSNFKYLFYKMLSNFLVLLTIAFLVFLMSVVLFFLYNDGFPFELLQFVKPYLFIIVTALVLVSAIGVVLEVFFGKYTVLQNVIFFFLFSFLMSFILNNDSKYGWDVFGNKIVIHQMEEMVQDILQTDEKTSLNIGYVLGTKKQISKFEFNGIHFPISFILSRFLWIIASILLVALTSPFFHRFDQKERNTPKKLSVTKESLPSKKEIHLSSLSLPRINYGILPLLKTEFLLLVRKGKKWLWFINLLGMALLVFLPLKISHQMVLPILWFLQVSRIADIATKERANNIHYFAFTSYRPLNRLLVSQWLSGIVLMLCLALPLLIRLLILGDFMAVLAILFGSMFIVLLAAVLGLLSQGKKLFEVLFFMMTYALLNSIPFTDYFGGFAHQKGYLIQLIVIVLLLGVSGFLIRKQQLQK